MLSGAFHMRKLLNSYGQYFEVLVRPTVFESLWPRILQVLVWFWFCWHCLPACVSAGSGRGARFGVLFFTVAQGFQRSDAWNFDASN